MRGKLRYDRRMRYWTGLSTLSVVVVFALAAAAQVTQTQSNGVPPSVTSPGVGGRQFNGVPPSVTSVGFGGRAFNGPPPGVTSVTNIVPRPGPVRVHPQPTPERHRRHDHETYYYPYFIPYYPVVDPYAYGGPVDGQPSADPEEQDQYQGGPTIFDRRGSGERARNDYGDDPPAPTAKHVHEPEARQEAPDPPDPPPAAAAAPVANQPSTILVFKDGHKQEVSNYAIVGANLFDLTPGHRLKIALADLDVAATEKANEDQGVDFTLPASPGGN